METTELQHHSLDVFDDGGVYIDCQRLYYAYFRKIPTIITIGELNGTRIRKWFDTEFEKRIKIRHSRKHYNRSKKEISYVDAFYLLDSNLLVNLQSDKARLLFQPSQEKEATELIHKLKQFTRRMVKTQEISVVVNSFGGLTTSPLKIRKPKLKLAENYNDDLLLLHEKIIPSLQKKDKSGLYLFHGLPGTGKSTYIRYLIRSITKKVIFMSPGLAGNLDTYDVANLLIENANTVFVIEDAEELICSRDFNKNSSISMLLNLTDGLLGESLGIQVIATFNTSVKNIDKALMRKGRLIAMYDFKPLEIQKSKALLQNLGFGNYSVCQPMTLADIFNIEQLGYLENNSSRPQIGFSANAVIPN